MLFEITNYLDLFFRTSIKVEGEDLAFERLGNFFLGPLKNVIGGRKVVLYTNSYLEKFSSLHTEDLRYPWYILISTIAGTCIKILAWIFEKGAFARNRKLHELQIKSLAKFQDWKRNNDLCNKLAVKPIVTKLDTSKDSLLDLPEEITLYIVSFIKEKKDLYNVSLTCAHLYRFAHDNSITSKTYNIVKPAKVFGSLPKGLHNLIKHCTGNRINLPAHRISDYQYDLSFQRYGSSKICDGVDFLTAEDLRGSTVKWGISPVPFMAIQVKYKKEDDRFLLSLFTKLAFKLGCRSDKIIERKGVITITKQNVIMDDKISLRYEWRYRYPWETESWTPTTADPFSLIVFSNFVKQITDESHTGPVHFELSPPLPLTS